MFDQPHRTIDLGHSDIATYRTGEGPDLLFIHGWPLSSATYRNLVPILAKRFTCHLIDLPGAGLTKVRDRTAIDMRRHVDTVMQAIDALELKRYAMVAHDSGGMLTRTVAAERPDQVFALVLGNTEMPGHISTAFKLFAAAGSSGPGKWLMLQALRSRALRNSPAFYGSCFDDTAHADGEFFELFIAPMLASRTRAHAQFELLADFDWSMTEGMAEVHRRIHCPVQMIWGKSDPWFPLHSAKACRPQFGGDTELEVLDGKLFVHEEHAATFARLASDFLARHATVRADVPARAVA